MDNRNYLVASPFQISTNALKISSYLLKDSAVNKYIPTHQL